MHASSTLRSLWFLAVAALLAVGCKQSEGEPCEADSDCAGELVCSCDFDGMRRGVCVEEGSPDICPETDAGPPPDAGPRDAGPDGAVAPDAGTDAGPADAGTDAGPPDAGPPDAGPPDAGTDAGPDAG